MALQKAQDGMWVPFFQSVVDKGSQNPPLPGKHDSNGIASYSDTLCKTSKNTQEGMRGKLAMMAKFPKHIIHIKCLWVKVDWQWLVFGIDGKTS